VDFGAGGIFSSSALPTRRSCAGFRVSEATADLVNLFDDGIGGDETSDL
jgi:hypothetical protein